MAKEDFKENELSVTSPRIQGEMIPVDSSREMPNRSFTHLIVDEEEVKKIAKLERYYTNGKIDRTKFRY